MPDTETLQDQKDRRRAVPGYTGDTMQPTAFCANPALLNRRVVSALVTPDTASRSNPNREPYRQLIAVDETGRAFCLLSGDPIIGTYRRT